MSYNLHKLKSLVEALGAAPLEMLEGNKIESLGKSIEKVLLFMESHRVDLEIDHLLSSIASQHRPLFDHAVKQSGWKKGTTSSDKENYLKELRRIENGFEKELKKYDAIKRKIVLSDVEIGLKTVTALTEEERVRLALFTNLTKPSGNGKSTLYKVPTKPRAIYTWIEALKEGYNRNIMTLED